MTVQMIHEALSQAAPVALDAAAGPGHAAGAKLAPRVPQWVMLARAGTWRGHPSTEEVITSARLHSAIDYFNRHYAPHGTDLVVDYHHSSIIAPRQGTLAPAAGWIAEMALRADGVELWGRVLWTAEAAALIARRQFRYLSPALRFDTPDRVTGEPVPMIIHSVALTNTPFLTELESLNADAGSVVIEGSNEAGAMDGDGPTVTSDEGGESMSLLNAIAAALGQEPGQVASTLGLEGADDERVAQAIVANATRMTELEAQVETIPEFVANSLGVAADADQKAVKVALLRLKAPGAVLAPIRSKLGLPGTASQSEVLNAIGTLQQARRKGEAEQLVDAAVASGRIPPAHRGFYLHEAENDPEAAREVINSLPVLTVPQRRPSRPVARELSEGEESVCGQLGLSAEAFLRADS